MIGQRSQIFIGSDLIDDGPSLTTSILRETRFRYLRADHNGLVSTQVNPCFRSMILIWNEWPDGNYDL